MTQYPFQCPKLVLLNKNSLRPRLGLLLANLLRPCHWVCYLVYLASAMPQGLSPLRYIMLGDESPLVFPVLLILLSTWLIPRKIESYLQKTPSQIGRLGFLVHRFGPLVLVGFMIFDRVKSIFQRDISYLEISQRLGPGEFQISDLRLLITGDGAPEIVLLSLLGFALLSHKLPSISTSADELKKTIQHRIMSLYFIFRTYFILDILPRIFILSTGFFTT